MQGVAQTTTQVYIINTSYHQKKKKKPYEKYILALGWLGRSVIAGACGSGWCLVTKGTGNMLVCE